MGQTRPLLLARPDDKPLTFDEREGEASTWPTRWRLRQTNGRTATRRPAAT